MKKLFCFGYGYTCDYLGHALSSPKQYKTPWQLAGTTRDPEKKQQLNNKGIAAYLFDKTHPLPQAARVLDGVTHILISTPPEDEGDPTFLAQGDLIRTLPSLEWLGYLSTTGVYGNRDGGTVDESSSLRPTSQRGSRRLITEEQWLSLYKSCGVPVHIFRLAGIYGPGRSALDSVRAGVARRIDKPGQMFNRIHVEDIIQVLSASMDNPNAGRVYNVTDDHPAPSHEVIAEACRLLRRPMPPLIPYTQADLAPMARSFYTDNKRVKNTRIKEELGIQLKYPDFKEGLTGCLEAEDYAKKQLFSGMS
jgi:nucleoside-diphosphate-sugar epimerase